jgi:hypothetical protein
VRLHLFDGENLEWRTIGITADLRFKACGSA